MMKKIVGVFVCIMMVLPIVSTISIADSGPKLDVIIFGSLRLFGIDRVGGVIINYGDVDACDVEYTFIVIDNSDNSIIFTYNGIVGDIAGIEHGTTHSVGLNFPRAAYGYGPITLVLTATSSNALDVSETAHGFQIGYFTFVF